MLCPVNTHTKVSFLMVVHGENALWVSGEFFLCNTMRYHWAKLEARLNGQCCNQI